MKFFTYTTLPRRTNCSASNNNGSVILKMLFLTCCFGIVLLPQTQVAEAQVNATELHCSTFDIKDTLTLLSKYSNRQRRHAERVARNLRREAETSRDMFLANRQVRLVRDLSDQNNGLSFSLPASVALNCDPSALCSSTAISSTTNFYSNNALEMCDHINKMIARLKKRGASQSKVAQLRRRNVRLADLASVEATLLPKTTSSCVN